MNFVQGSCEGGSFLSSGPKTVVKKEKKRYDNRWMPFLAAVDFDKGVCLLCALMNDF